MASATTVPAAIDSDILNSGISIPPTTIPNFLNDTDLRSQFAEETTKSSTNLLISSPYTTPDHLLDLSTLPTQSRLLAQALTVLTPIRPDYATAPYTESFNWPTVFETLSTLSEAEPHTWTTNSFYVVVFRSVLNEDVDLDRLSLLDERSHAEATESGGLLKYWFGVKNGRRENLATCVWRSRQDARAGGTGPWHAKARAAAKNIYENITFTTLELVIEDNVKRWEIRPWKD
ncbi:hypothetical protein BJY04DRAFT_93681 [Aspergillus karnatakaensis]|uniref:uncharacterized protein n=1 Tax=Aspergillus karnatakaensis TaxID=1810916 RepID=UPI003CCD867E